MVSETSARISVKVKPRASRNEVEGWQENTLVVSLTSPPVDGAANNSLIRLLAKRAGIARSRIRIVSGEKGRLKILEFEGLDLADLKENFS